MKGVNQAKYRLLKFTDARDPRHQHLYDVSGYMIENWENQNKRSKSTKEGRLLELNDNWCLLPNNITKSKGWNGAPYPHRGHPVLYIPGHWGSFSQARSIGAHGTRWTGRSLHGKRLHDVYDSFLNGRGMHDGRNLNAPKTEDQFMDWYQSSYSLSYLNEFVMDVYSLDFNEEGAALHPSILLRQAEFFAKAVETMVDGCNLNGTGTTIVAHSIGAWVVRISLKMHPHLVERGWVKNVITLASPLGGVPYAVDAGVHDIARHLNDDDRNIGNVTFISVSGGLRDEMIPPEVCEIPSGTHDITKPNSEAFLATTILNRNMKNTKYQYGMDHRAIVWCYDLLKVVREVIFTLAVTSDQDMTPQNRMKVARKVMLGKRRENQSSFKQDTEQQRDLLLSEKGYVKTVAIQLASPYNLNSLLKLAISALMLDLHVLAPIRYYFRPATYILSGSYFTMFQRSMTCALLTPVLLTVIHTIRRLLLQFDNENESRMLLGTAFVHMQLAAVIGMVICVIASGIHKCYILLMRGKNSTKSKPQCNAFGPIIYQFLGNSLRHLFFIVLPMIACIICAFHYFSDTAEFVLNKVSIGSCCFISVQTLLLLVASKSLIMLSDWSFHSECKVVLVFLLATIKATHGTTLYAFSLSTLTGQIDSDLYDKFLAMTMSIRGSTFGQHCELVSCIVTRVVPTFIAIFSVRAYATARVQFNTSSNNNTVEDEAACVLNVVKMNGLERYRNLRAVKASLSLWYTWNVFSVTSHDELLIPAYATLIFISYYLKNIPISSAAVEIYSAVVRNDLSLCCSVVSDHNKKE